MANNFKLKNGFDAQVSAVYLAPDIIPQGKIASRFTFDLGLRKKVNKGKGEIIFNANDLFNTMIVKNTIHGNGFHYTSQNYNETQVFRLGYNYIF